MQNNYIPDTITAIETKRLPRKQKKRLASVLRRFKGRYQCIMKQLNKGNTCTNEVGFNFSSGELIYSNANFKKTYLNKVPKTD